MNVKIKRIIIISLALTIFFIASPSKDMKFINSNNIAYASSDDDEDESDSYLDDLDISEGNIHFSEKKTDYTVKIDRDTEYFVVKAKAKNSDDEIKINNEVIPLDGDNIAEKKIKLDKGRNLIKIKLVPDDYDGGLRIYNLVVNRGSASTSSSSSDDSDVYLNNIVLSDGNLSFSQDKTSYDVNVNSSISEIRIKAEPEDDNDEVKINKVKVLKDEDYRRTVELKNGENEVVIDLEDNQGNEKIYTLNINRGGTASASASEEIDNNQDPIYLNDIVIQDGSIPLNFKPKVTSYAVDVKDDCDSVLIKAKPEGDDVVRLNGSECKPPYVRRVSLKEGKNIVEVKVNNSETYDKTDDEYEERTYTLTIYRGTSEGTSKAENVTGSNSIESNGREIKINQWINVNGKWQYNDSMGNPIKNMWYFDKEYGKQYFLKADGTMATGWITYNGSWYYLDNTGAMVTGWFKDTNGSWYYLYSYGAMASNTTVDGYKLGSNGAWIH